MALPEFSMRQLLEVGRPFRPPPAALESEDGAVHLWPAQRHPHSRPDPDRALAAPGAGDACAKSPPAAAASCSSAPSARLPSRSPPPPSAAPSITSTIAGWAARSPTGRPSRHSIKRLRTIEETLTSAGESGLTKKELLGLLREQDKLEKSLGGIKEMGGVPNLLFVIDTNKEAIAISEAKKLGIPVMAILDSNSDPDGIAFRSRAMTTPPAPSRCIATWPPAR